MPVPIWKDYIVSFGAVDEADYTIVTGGETIFSGHAVKRPDAANLTVRINDVCADYLAHAVPAVGLLKCTADPMTATFVVKKGGTTVDTVTFEADWSYDYGHTAAHPADPVNGRVSALQTLVASVSGGSAVTAQVLLSGGTTQTLTITGSGGAAQSVSIPLDSIQNVKEVSVGGHSYKVVDACARYALLYVNAYGGWDTLLMDGRPGMEDGYDRHKMLQEYDNATRSNRGTVEYANEVTRRWTLRTGWLRDDEAARMHHVLGSTDVYLYDIPAAALTPVTIAETTCEYKTYKGNGARPVQYAITVELAQEIVRR